MRRRTTRRKTRRRTTRRAFKAHPQEPHSSSAHDLVDDEKRSEIMNPKV